MYRFRKSTIRFLPALLLVVTALGCGPRKPSVVSVTGVVTLDGKPVEKAAVTLVPSEAQAAGLPASGITDQQGRFTLSTDKIGPGAMPGEYRATVIKKETTGFVADKNGLSGGIAPGGIKEKWIIPQKYANPNTSGLAVSVKAGMTPFDLDLKSRE